MAIQVGELLIKMGADVAQLRTDMAQSKAVVKSTMADIESAVSVAKTALVALAGVGSAASFVGMIRGTIEAKARLYDLSLITNETVENLSALIAAGKLSGTTGETIATSMNKLSKNLAGVGEDSKGAAQAIKGLKLNFDDFKGLSPAEQMLAVAKSLEQFRDGAGKSQATMLLFGKTGAELLPFLKELATTNQLVAKETTENARRAKEFEENLVRLKTAGDEWKKVLVNDMLPALIDFSSQLLEGKKAYGGWLQALVDIGVNVDPFKNLGENIVSTREQMDRLRSDMQKFRELEATPTMLGGSRQGMFKNELAALQGQLDLLTKRDTYLKAEQARQALKLGQGVADDPRIAVRKGELSIDGREKDKITEAQRLIATIRERIGQEDLEAQIGRKLTQGEKEAVDVMVQLRDGKLEATQAERLLIAALLERRLTQERLNDVNEQERQDQIERSKARQRLIDEAQKEAESIRDLVKAQDEQNAVIGKSQRELKEHEIALTLDAAARKRSTAASIESIPGSEKMVEQLLAESRALDALANSKAKSLMREDALRGDAFAGARRGLQDYRAEISDVNSAAYNLVRDTARGLEDEATRAFGNIAHSGNRLVDQLINEFFRLSVVRPLLNSLLGSSFGGGITSFVGSLLGSSGGASAGSSLTSVVASVPALAMSVSPSGGRDSARSVTIQQSVVNHIDSRSDRAQIEQITNKSAADGNRELVKQLRAQGVL